MDQHYFALIQSERVSEKTREELLKRAEPMDAPHEPRIVSRPAYAVLRGVAELLIPQQDADEIIDLAALLDRQRSTEIGDGWRYSDMPSDAVALALGLEALQQTCNSKFACDFLQLDRPKQIELLQAVQKGEHKWSRVNAAKWFEDLLADLTEIYVSHPSTLAALGFSGIAFLPRWSEVGLDTAQPWEPKGISADGKCP